MLSIMLILGYILQLYRIKCIIIYFQMIHSFGKKYLIYVLLKLLNYLDFQERKKPF